MSAGLLALVVSPSPFVSLRNIGIAQRGGVAVSIESARVYPCAKIYIYVISTSRLLVRHMFRASDTSLRGDSCGGWYLCRMFLETESEILELTNLEAQRHISSDLDLGYCPQEFRY